MSCCLQRCLEAGARLAQPGEFTLRAFLNGRLDLSQAESVAQVGKGALGCSICSCNGSSSISVPLPTGLLRFMPAHQHLPCLLFPPAPGPRSWWTLALWRPPTRRWLGCLGGWDARCRRCGSNALTF